VISGTSTDIGAATRVITANVAEAEDGADGFERSGLIFFDSTLSSIVAGAW
jgi:hypothetical protein